MTNQPTVRQRGSTFVLTFDDGQEQEVTAPRRAWDHVSNRPNSVEGEIACRQWFLVWCESQNIIPGSIKLESAE